MHIYVLQGMHGVGEGRRGWSRDVEEGQLTWGLSKEVGDGSRDVEDSQGTRGTVKGHRGRPRDAEGGQGSGRW